MRVLVAVMLIGCSGGMPMLDAGEDAGGDAGPPLIRTDFAYRYRAPDAGCDVCRQTRMLTEAEVIRARGTYNSVVTGWMCRLEPQGAPHDGGAVSIDCTARCEYPPEVPDAGGCGWLF